MAFSLVGLFSLTGSAGPLPQPAPGPFFPATTRFYAAPDTLAAGWVRAHPRDRRAAVIRERIAAQSQAVWLTDPNPATVQGRVRAVVRPAEARGMVPVLVAYAIPRRDCDHASQGGAGDVTTYREWIGQFARGLGAATAVVVLEPDALADVGCLGGRERADRYAALSFAARTLQRYAPRARVYYDGGNSAWHPVRTMAERLERAGLREYGDGIALNVSNFNRTGEEIRYGLSLLEELDVPRSGMVVDTSRNGAGPAPGHRFCDPPRRRLGKRPTADTRISRVDAYLWVKDPGQADGCAAAAGTFDPGYAYRLAD